MTLPRSDAGPESVVRTVVLDAPPEHVWEALTEAAMLREWLAPEVELEPHEGGSVRCRFKDGEERRGEVELVEEVERLAFSWHRDGAGWSAALTRLPLALGRLVLA